MQGGATLEHVATTQHSPSRQTILPAHTTPAPAPPPLPRARAPATKHTPTCHVHTPCWPCPPPAAQTWLHARQPPPPPTPLHRPISACPTACRLATNTPVACIFHAGHTNSLQPSLGCVQRRNVHQVGQVGSTEAGRATSNGVQIHIRGKGNVLQSHMQGAEKK